MRKNVKSEKVIRAMAIGISAMLMASSPLTALAAEPGEGSEPEKTPDIEGTQAQTETTAEKIKAAEDAAAKAEGAAETAAESEKTVINVVKDIVASEEEVTEEEETEETAEEKIQMAAEELDNAANSQNEEGESVNTADTKVESAEDAISDLTDQATDVDNALSSADEKVEQIESIASDLAETLEDAQDAVNADVSAIEEAESVADADAALADATETVEAAEATVEEARTAYETARADYDQAVEELNAAVEAYNETVAKAESDAAHAKANLDEVKAKADALAEAVKAAKEDYEKAQQKADANLNKSQKAYEDALAAYTDAVKAQVEAQNAYEKTTVDSEQAMEAAKQAMEAAEQAMDEAEDKKAAADQAVTEAALTDAQTAAMEIIKKEQEIQEGKKNDWNNLDVLFNMVMEGYYIPEVLAKNSEMLPDGATYELDEKFTKFADDSKNYVKFVVTDKDGNKTEHYFNYKLEDGKSLIIFEKVWEDVEVANEDAERFVVYNGENGTIGTSVDKAELQSKLDANEIVADVNEETGETKYYLKGNAVEDSIEQMWEEKDTDEEKQILTDDGKEAEVTYSVNEAGQIVKTVTDSVTTISYQGASLAGGSGFSSKEAAEQAAKEELTDDYRNLNADYTATVKAEAEAKAEITYVTTFTTTIDLKGMTNKVAANTSEKEGAEESKEEIAEDAIEDAKDYLEGKEYYVVSTSISNLNVTRTNDKDITWKPSTWGNMDTYTATSGTLSVTYAKVVKTPVKLDSFTALGNDIKDLLWHGKANEAEEKAVIQQLENKKLADYDAYAYYEVKNGSTFADLWKGCLWTADAYYTQKNTAIGCGTGRATITNESGDVSKAESEAKAEAETAAKNNALAAAQKAADNAINDSITNGLQDTVNSKKTGATTVANVVVTTKGAKATADKAEVKKESVSSGTTWSYSGTYDKATGKKTEDTVISKEIYNAEELTGVRKERTNINYNNYKKTGDASGILLFEKTDENFKNYKAAAQAAADKLKAAVELAKVAGSYEEDQADFAAADALLNNYSDLLNKAKAAQKDVETAQSAVETLQEKIAALKNDANAKQSELVDLEARLLDAQKKLDDATKEFGNLQDDLDDAREAYNATVDRLTPAPAPVVPAPVVPTGGDDIADTTDDAGTEDTETAVATPVVLANVPAATVNVVAPAPVVQPEVVEIEEEVTPLAPSVEENEQENKQENKQEETKAEPESQETIQLDDEATPLADIIVEDEQTKMSWWWLLIVALLGATGYEMYKKHNEKKALAENAEQDAE